MKLFKESIVTLLIVTGFIVLYFLFSFEMDEIIHPEIIIEQSLLDLQGSERDEWFASLMNTTELGMGFDHPNEAIKPIITILGDSNYNNHEALWWYLQQITGPEQREILEPLASDTITTWDDTKPDFRYQALIVLLKTGSIPGTELVKSYIQSEKNRRTDLKIGLIEELSFSLTDEAESALQTILNSEYGTLVNNIRTTIDKRLQYYVIVKSIIEPHIADPDLEKTLSLHILTILNSSFPQVINSRYERIKNYLGEIEAKQLLLKTAGKIEDPEMLSKINALI